ncbi:hypothetical protein V5799_012665 [Amblyomma americanum]|uniref:Monocarboxylate transporter n=1 Tax=Amblyomma americanum TaxID=6943 RepID=A0AAQ4EE16_AMBAM
MATSTACHSLKPDCSWSWTVALACSATNFFTAPMTYSAGVVYTYIMELYSVSRQDAAWPLSIVPFSLNIVAPLVGITVKKIGIRPVAVAGALISSVSVALCFFAPNVTYLSVFLGGFYGIGTGMLVIPNAVCVNTWFDRKRASASGLVHAGTTLSAFVFPTLFRYCADAFGLRGGFLIFGAIMMNATAFSFVVRSPPWTSMRGEGKKSPEPPHAPRRSSATAGLIRAGRQRHYRSFTSVGENAKHGRDNHAFDVGTEDFEVHRTSKSFTTTGETGTGILNDASTPSPPELVAIECPDTNSAGKWNVGSVLRRKNMQLSHSVHSTSSETSSCSRKAEYGESAGQRLGVESAKQDGSELCAVKTPPSYESSESNGEQTGLCTTLFVLVCVTFVVVMNTLMMFMTVVMDFASDRGIPLKKAVYLICGFAAADIAGRLCCGWAADGDRLSHKTIVGACCVLLGACFAVSGRYVGHSELFLIPQMLLCLQYLHGSA